MWSRQSTGGVDGTVVVLCLQGCFGAAVLRNGCKVVVLVEVTVVVASLESCMCERGAFDRQPFSSISLISSFSVFDGIAHSPSLLSPTTRPLSIPVLRLDG